jgi:rod shape-determining protein MreC
VALSRRTGRSRFTLILLILTSVTVITLDFRGESSGVIETIRETALDAFAPVKDAADSVFSPVSNAWNGIFNYDDLAEENARLRDQLAEVQGEEDQAEDLREDLDAITEQQHLSFSGDIEKVDARVVTSPISNFELSFEIDKGRRDGIREDMPVVGARGLVGRVVRVSRGQSVVQLITDSDFSVGVRLVRTGEVALASGRGRDQDLLVTLVNEQVGVRPGELAATSGLRQSGFPPNIPVGRVRTVSPAEGGFSKRLKLRPNVDTDTLRYVSVLLWKPTP